nr:Pr6Pr family membrane protein [Agromyces seonyuensis]
MLGWDRRFAFFTTQSNILVLAYFGVGLHLMLARRTTAMPAPRLRGAVTLYLTVTCLISHFLLNDGENPLPGLVVPEPAAALENNALFLVHYVVPVMVLLDWIAFGPRGIVRWRDLPVWLIYPTVYGLLMLWRGIALPDVPDRFPYPFIDPEGRDVGDIVLGLVQVVVYIALLGVLVIGIDRIAGLVARSRSAATAAARPTPTPEPGPATESASESRTVGS